MREVNIVIPADLQNPFDVFDALQFKAQVWDEYRRYLTEFYSKMSRSSGKDFWNWFITGEKPKKPSYHTQANVLSQVNMRLQSFQSREDIYGEESRKHARDTLVKQGLFPENIPFHILTFKLPEEVLGRLIFSGEVERFRWSVQGLLRELSKKEEGESEEKNPFFAIVDKKSQSVCVPKIVFDGFSQEHVSITGSFKVDIPGL